MRYVCQFIRHAIKTHISLVVRFHTNTDNPTYKHFVTSVCSQGIAHDNNVPIESKVVCCMVQDIVPSNYKTYL